ncbi:MAG: ribokinase [Verrucomicrobiae bacterium]|nr:ribokinase [Verrucomicrobiae bacterium]
MASPVIVVGSYVQDLTFTLPQFPKPGQTLIGQFHTGAGGKGSNQAVAAARTGVKVAFIGATGDDAFAQVASEFHEKEGIDSHLAVKPDLATGTAGILVNDQGENEIVVALGANNALRPEDIDAAWPRKAMVLVTQLECNLDATGHALELARSEGIRTILNPAPMRDDFPMSLLNLVDILVPNETEFAHLVRSRFPEKYGKFNESSIESMEAEDLHRLCRDFEVPTLIVTLGGKGSFCSTGDTFFHTKPLSNITVVDTTGAGDAFVGGLASGLVQFDGNLVEGIQFASRVAGLSVTKIGTAQAMPTAKEIENTIKDR